MCMSALDARFFPFWKQSMMFPTVTTSAGNGYGEGEGGKGQGSGGKDKKKRREGREGRERREGRRARDDGKDAVRDEGSIDDEGYGLGDGNTSNVSAVGEWEAPESPKAGASEHVAGGSLDGLVPGSLGVAARMRMDSSLLALAGELPWGHDDMQKGLQHSAQVPAGDEHIADAPADVSGGPLQAAALQDEENAAYKPSVSILDQPGNGGSQALYEMFKAAADGGLGEAGWQSPMLSPRRGDRDSWAMSNLKLEQGQAVALTPGAAGGETCSPEVRATEEGDEEAWAAGIDRWVGGPASFPHPWVDLQ